REGYVDVTATAPASGTAVPLAAQAVSTPSIDKREQAVVNRLRQGYASPLRSVRGKKPWRLSRAIWRAGELGLHSAEPLLLDLLEQTRQKKAQRRQKPKHNQFDRQETEQLLGQRTLRLPPARRGWRSAQWSETFTPPEDLLLYSLAWSLGRC